MLQELFFQTWESSEYLYNCWKEPESRGIETMLGYAQASNTLK